MSEPIVDAGDVTVTDVATAEDAEPIPSEEVAAALAEESPPTFDAPTTSGVTTEVLAVATNAPTAPPRRGGTLVLGGAMLASLAAIAAPFVPALAAAGISSGSCAVLAAVLFAMRSGQRRLASVQEQLLANHETVHRQLEGDAPGRAAAHGEELQHLLMSLQRQDEKINNLTKAIKMYGKPLMDISGQSTELVGAVASIKQVVEHAATSQQQTLSSLATRGDLGKVTDSLGGIALKVEAAAGKTTTVSLEPLQQQLSRLEVSLAAVAQRLESSEVQKSLLRLEEASQKGQHAVQELLKGDTVRQATTQLQQCVDDATKGLAEGIGQLREGNLGRLETTVRDIQREVAGVATTIAQLNAAMRNAPRQAVAAPTTSSPSEPAAVVASTSAPAADAALPTATPASSNPATTGGEASGYQTGTRTTASANVLGAIARLKKMKG